MSDEKPQAHCPQCSQPLPPGSARGLCPACLLKRGLETNTVAASAAGGSNHGWKTPTVEELSGLFPELDIIELIGRGGMGAVYKARQQKLDRLVALKILPPEIGADPSFAQRFEREAQAMARLSHPNIVTIHDFGKREIGATPKRSLLGGDDARTPNETAVGGGTSDQAQALPPAVYFFIMEYVDGLSLRQLLDACGEQGRTAGAMNPREALAIVPQICDALQYAHDRGIVHRDIKPENILLSRAGQVKIADFGLAKLVGRDAAVPPAVEALDNDRSRGARETRGQDGHATRGPEARVTLGEHVVGTPQYMAPEQIDRPGAVDHRADIYSLGVVFYQMLTGELPKGPSGELAGRFEPPSRKVIIDVRLDEVVLRALEREPERRYQQASQVRTEVETIASSPSPSKGEGRGEGEAPGDAQKGAADIDASLEFGKSGRGVRFKKQIVLVGARGGKAVVNWPGVLKVLISAFVIFVLCGILFDVVFGVSYRNAFMTGLFVAWSMFCVLLWSQIRNSLRTPPDQLVPLDRPPTPRTVSQQDSGKHQGQDAPGAHRQDPHTIEAARCAVRIPAIGLMVAAIIQIALSIFSAGAIAHAEQFGEPVFVIATLGSIAVGAFILWGAYGMTRLRRYLVAVAVTILSATLGVLGLVTLSEVPIAFRGAVAMSPRNVGYVIGLAFGIWALVVLSRREVIEAFQAVRNGAGPKRGVLGGADRNTPNQTTVGGGADEPARANRPRFKSASIVFLVAGICLLAAAAIIPSLTLPQLAALSRDSEQALPRLTELVVSIPVFVYWAIAIVAAAILIVKELLPWKAVTLAINIAACVLLVAALAAEAAALVLPLWSMSFVSDSSPAARPSTPQQPTLVGTWALRERQDPAPVGRRQFVSTEGAVITFGADGTMEAYVPDSPVQCQSGTYRRDGNKLLIHVANGHPPATHAVTFDLRGDTFTMAGEGTVNTFERITLQEAIVGKWRLRQVDGSPVGHQEFAGTEGETATFNSDGTLEVHVPESSAQNQSGTYRIEGNKLLLRLAVGGQSEISDTFNLRGGRLTVTDEKGVVGTFERMSAGAEGQPDMAASGGRHATQPAPRQLAPGASAACPLQATFYELRLPAADVGKLDKDALTAAAKSADGLELALAKLGKARAIYRMDQSVPLDRTHTKFSVESYAPFVTRSMLTDRGQTINTLQYSPAETRLQISGEPAADGSISTKIEANVKTVEAAGPASMPAVIPQMPVVHSASLSHSGQTKPGEPIVIFSVAGQAGKDSVAFVVCITPGEPRPLAPVTSDHGATCPLKAQIYELHVDKSSLGRLSADHIEPLYSVAQSVKLAGDQIKINDTVPVVTTVRLDPKGEMITNVEYESAGVILNVEGAAASDGSIAARLRVDVSGVGDSSIKIADKTPARVMRRSLMSYAGTITPGKPVVLLSADGATLDADGKAVAYLAVVDMGKSQNTASPAIHTAETQPASDSVSDAVAMISVLKSWFGSAYQALIEKNDPKAALDILNSAMPDIYRWRDMLKGTGAEATAAMAVKQVETIRDALKAGDTTKAKALMAGLNNAGQQIEDSLRASATRTAETQPAGHGALPAAQSQPAASKLEFRIAPNASALDKAELASYMDWLKAGRVGFWWKDGRIRGRMPDHAWLPWAGEANTAGGLVTGEYKGQRYVLVSDKPGQTLVPGEGKDAWGLASARATKDEFNRPAVEVIFDNAGRARFAQLTMANVTNTLAIIVDGKVISAPVIKTTIAEKAVITGKFTKEEAERLALALGSGMARPSTQPAPSTRSGQATQPSSTRAVRLEGAFQKPGEYEIEAGGISLQDAIALAGGVYKSRLNRGQIYVVQRPAEGSGAGAEVKAIDFRQLEAGDPRLNIRIKPGDLVVAPLAAQGEFYVMGQVARPGVYSLTNRAVTIKMAVASAGQAPGKQPPDKATLIRQLSGNREEFIPLDMGAIFMDRAQDMLLQANDLLFVGPGVEAVDVKPIRPAAVDAGARQAEFYVMGKVERTGVYSMTERKITIKMALAAAGNPADGQWPEKSTLIRRTDDKEELIPLNLKAVVKGQSQDMFLQPDDVLVVGSEVDAAGAKAARAQATQPSTQPARNSVIIHGNVPRAGEFPIPPISTLRVALKEVGKTSIDEKREEILIIAPGEQGGRLIINGDAILKGSVPDVALKPGDIVYVGALLAKAPATQPAATQPAGSETPRQKADREAAEAAARKFLVAMRDGKIDEAKACCIGSVAGWTKKIERRPDSMSPTMSEKTAEEFLIPVGMFEKHVERVSGQLASYYGKAPELLTTFIKTSLSGDMAVVIADSPPPTNCRYTVVTLMWSYGRWLVYDVDDAPSFMKLMAIDRQWLRPSIWPGFLGGMQAIYLNPKWVVDLDTGFFAVPGEPGYMGAGEATWDIRVSQADGAITRNPKRQPPLLALTDAKSFAEASELAFKRLKELERSKEEAIPAGVRFFSILTESQKKRRMAVVEVIDIGSGRSAIAWTYHVGIPEPPTGKPELLQWHLSAMRGQVELYKHQHLEKLPGVDDKGRFDGELFARVLTLRTNAKSEASRDPENPLDYPFGPYVNEMPANPYVAEEAVAVRVKGGPGKAPNDGTSGWWFDTTIGLLSPNHIPSAATQPATQPATKPGEKN